MSLFQTNVRFLGHNICQGSIEPIQRVLEFATKFPDEIIDKKQLQRFLGSLNYISPFYKNLSRDLAPLYDRLKKDHKTPWTPAHTDLVKNDRSSLADSQRTWSWPTPKSCIFAIRRTNQSGIFPPKKYSQKLCI
ncbi:hypothetical protein P3S67_012309 [Capsicum chacoense]